MLMRPIVDRRAGRDRRRIARLTGNESTDGDAIPSERDRAVAPTARAIVDQRGLVERAREGDHDAFAVLARAASARLDAAARLILRDNELARDAVQEALVRAWRDLPGLRDPERFDAWLHRLTVNSCLDSARRRRRRPIEVELTPISAPAVGDHAAAVVNRDLLDDALRRLEPEWRAVVVLHYFLGMPLPDVAVALRIPLGTAKSRLHRSLGAMRSTIERAEAGTPAPVPGGQFA
jgi:RNA polymerase sigma-70 factor (ECF subfamily)